MRIMSSTCRVEAVGTRVGMVGGVGGVVLAVCVMRVERVEVLTVEAVMAVEMVAGEEVEHLHERPCVGPLERLVARPAQ